MPEEIEFQTKPEIALNQMARALEWGLPRGVVSADTGYGSGTRFRERLAEMGLEYVVGLQGSVMVWRPGEAPLPPQARGRMGTTPNLLRRSKDLQPVSARELVLEMGAGALRRVAWREGSNRRLGSRFVAVQVRPAHRDYWRAEPHEELWLLAEWPRGAAEPAKHRWIVERACLERKQELATGTFGRALVARVSPSRDAVHCGLWVSGGRKEPSFPPRRVRAGWSWQERSCRRTTGRGQHGGRSGAMRLARSRASGKESPAGCSGSGHAALFVRQEVYDSVVLQNVLFMTQ